MSTDAVSIHAGHLMRTLYMHMGRHEAVGRSWVMYKHCCTKPIKCINIVETFHRSDAVQVIIKKWGNSAGIRIPSSILAASGLKIDQAVDMREEAGRIVIEPMTTKEYDLAALLGAITPENVHKEVDFGGAVGQEFI